MTRHDGPDALEAAARDARARTLALLADLSDVQRHGPRLGHVNPLDWELGHIGWFAERWTCRRSGVPSRLADADALYDSMQVPHALRWDLPLPTRAQTEAYLAAGLQAAVASVHHPDATAEDRFHLRYVVHHEDMHGEALAYTRQTLGYPAPSWCRPPTTGAGDLPGDVHVPAGTYPIGAARDADFVFDNEKWRHPVSLRPYAIAAAPVTQAAFAAFVEAGGYDDAALWSPAGQAFKAMHAAAHPVYWRRGADGWEQRQFDRWVPLQPHAPVVHVSWYEAEAYCRLAGRRLPSEAEWEVAAGWDPATAAARRFAWGDAAPGSAHAHLDGAGTAVCDVADFPAGDSALGCRQMIGNVWEWTADWFAPYPGFVCDPYEAYSQPWFHSHRVLRGGSWMARSRLLRNTYRNYAVPTRRDLFAGFRTCAAR